MNLYKIRHKKAHNKQIFNKLKLVSHQGSVLKYNNYTLQLTVKKYIFTQLFTVSYTIHFVIFRMRGKWMVAEEYPPFLKNFKNIIKKLYYFNTIIAC